MEGGGGLYPHLSWDVVVNFLQMPFLDPVAECACNVISYCVLLN